MKGGGRAPRVVIALSGGVDSAVAAACLVEQGYDVTAVTLRLWHEPPVGDDPAAVGCADEAVARARRVAGVLGVPFRVLDATAGFRAHVVDYLVAEYGAGRTPNPCVPCNRFVRFDFLLRQALDLGARFLATGHYARLRRTREGRHQLLRGCDRAKDQSYFLHALSQDQLAHVLFPLGELSKEAVREMARERNLPAAGAPESQDLCFLAGGDYRRFLARYAPEAFQPGPIRDTSGRVMGRHRGLGGYTIGQRKGLDISAPEPLYVLAIEPGENALIVGTASELGRDVCTVDEMRYVSGRAPTAPFRAEAQIRYRAQPADVTVTPLARRGVRVRFATPQRDITPGQFLVLYDGDVVLGGAAICTAS